MVLAQPHYIFRFTSPMIFAMKRGTPVSNCDAIAGVLSCSRIVLVTAAVTAACIVL